MRLGNALADVMVTLASAQARIGRPVQFEQLCRSFMLHYPPVTAMMKEFRFEKATSAMHASTVHRRANRC